ncbi:hypothetical protein [Clostridioides difficile]|uniref:hypothetical protein n=1 Tax=Clostridioides difficile TaxID=1496 RepID=UPI003A8776C4
MLSLFWGFRLTIWNVNEIIIWWCTLLVPCFRLTIWNVNILLNGELIEVTVVLD